MADARLVLRINTILFAELRHAADELGSRLSASKLAEDIVESWVAQRRLPRCKEPFEQPGDLRLLR
jgi:hypothetical protein